MKTQPELQPHPASCAEAWENGWAKRPPNFPELLARADAWRWQPDQTVGRAAAVVAKATRFLKPTHRSVLAFYVEGLNAKRLAKSDAHVWNSVGYTAHMLNLSVRTVRDANSALERAGLIVRGYNLGNRPASEQAWNLAPLMDRLDELEDEAAAVADAYRAERSAWRDNVVEDFAARAAEGRRLEQSPNNEVDTVGGSAAPSARHRFVERQATPAGPGHAEADQHQPQHSHQALQGSPRGDVSSGGALSAPSVGARALQEQLAAALEVCPELREYVAANVVEDPSSATPADLARVCDAAQDLLPEPERNNSQTAMWGLRRHGLLVVVMLAVALKARRIQSRNGYFAGLALSDPSRSLDLSLNLAQLLRGPGKPNHEGRRPPHPPARPRPPLSEEAASTVITAPGADDPTWLAITAILAPRIRTGAFQAWFGNVGFHGISGDELRLSAPPTAAKKLMSEFRGPIADAAEDAGLGALVPVIRTRSVYNTDPWSEEAE